MTDAPNGSAPAGNPAPGAGDSGQPWYSGISDEGLRGYVQTKGFKDPSALAESYRNLEKLQGVPQERLLKLPEKHDDPAWGDIWGKLGRPEKPDGYEFKFDGDATLANRMAQVMHREGVTKPAAQAINQEWNTYVEELIKSDAEARKARDEQEITELKSKWGTQFDAQVEVGRRAGREFGLSEAEFEKISGALGSGKTLELFNLIGAKLGEAAPFDPSGSAGKGGFGITPQAAQARIQSLMDDKEWSTRFLNGGAVEKDEIIKLQKIVSGEL